MTKGSSDKRRVSKGQGRRKDGEILKVGNSNEAYEEEAKKPSVGIIDAQEEHAEADEKKDSGEKACEVANRGEKNALIRLVGISGTKDGVKVDWQRLAGTANGKIDGITGGGVGPIVFEGIEGSEEDAIDANDLVAGKQASLIGGTAVFNVIDGDAGGRRIKSGGAGTIKANLHGIVNCEVDIVHPQGSVKRSDKTKNYRKEIKERTRERSPRAHGKHSCKAGTINLE